MTKRVFLLQTEIGHPDPWDDSINLTNVGVSPGLGRTNNAGDFNNRIHFFQRVDNRFAITFSKYLDYPLVLKRPYSTHDQNTEVPLDFDLMAKLIDDHRWTCHEGTAKVIMFGSVIEEGASQQNAISNATYFVRNQEKILDVVNNIEHDNPKIIPWLFCYKADEVPLYYIVINPYSVQCIEDIEANYNGNYVYTITNHLKNLNEVIFKPYFSKNARVIGEHNLVVRGNTFTVNPFGSWFVKEKLQGFFDNTKVKVDTNFQYEWEGTKLKINTLNKTKGYLILRWNTGTGMDLIFHVSKNRFFRDYVVDIVE